MSLPCSAQTSTALAAGMIIRARTPSLIMQGAVRWPSRPSGGLCGCWWPLESSGAETSLLHDHAERHVLWRLSRGSHAAVHALMQRSSSRASSERDDSSILPSRDTAAHACSQSDCSESAESSSESAERLLSKRTLSLSRLGDKEDILRQANKCTSMIDRSVDYATIIST